MGLEGQINFINTEITRLKENEILSVKNEQFWEILNKSSLIKLNIGRFRTNTNALITLIEQLLRAIEKAGYYSVESKEMFKVLIENVIKRSNKDFFMPDNELNKMQTYLISFSKGLDKIQDYYQKYLAKEDLNISNKEILKLITNERQFVRWHREEMGSKLKLKINKPDYKFLCIFPLKLKLLERFSNQQFLLDEGNEELNYVTDLKNNARISEILRNISLNNCNTFQWQIIYLGSKKLEYIKQSYNDFRDKFNNYFTNYFNTLKAKPISLLPSEIDLLENIKDMVIRFNKRQKIKRDTYINEKIEEFEILLTQLKFQSYQ